MVQHKFSKKKTSLFSIKTFLFSYPSGRLAVQRLASPCLTTIFFDDSATHSFLGLINSSGNLILMEPTFHARFLTNHHHDFACLCDAKTGVIQKEFRTHSNHDNLLEFQLNSSMQIQYENATKISFSFACQNENVRFQLTKRVPTFKDLTSKILLANKISSTIKHSIPIQQENCCLLPSRKSIPQEITLLQDLDLLKKRVKSICHSWLKQCRTILGILNVNAYHLPDCSIEIEKQNLIPNQCVVKSLDREQIFLTNIISDAIEQFVPHSETGRTIKRRIYEKKLLSNCLPLVK